MPNDSGYSSEEVAYMALQYGLLTGEAQKKLEEVVALLRSIHDRIQSMRDIDPVADLKNAGLELEPQTELYLKTTTDAYRETAAEIMTEVEKLINAGEPEPLPEETPDVSV